MHEPSSPVAPRTARVGACPVCGAHEHGVLFMSTDRLHRTPGTYVYVECSSCRSVFQNPMVLQDDLALCYPTDYSPHVTRQAVSDNRDAEKPRRSRARDWIRQTIISQVRATPAVGVAGFVGWCLSRSSLLRERAFYGLVRDECLPAGKAYGKALDIGCGTGSMMERLKQVGWDVEGVEWSEAAAKIARHHTRLSVHTGDFRTLVLAVGRYRLIVLNHVFEHLNAPADALRRLWELLAPGGTVVLYYPNPHSTSARWFGPNWFHWDSPRHLVFPTGSALCELAMETGFSSAVVRTSARCSEEQWMRSKAYRRGLHPETARPALSTGERGGVWLERVGNLVGFHSGWETVAILKK